MARQASLKDHPLFRGVESEEWLGATATVPLLDWKAVVQAPASEALGPLHRLQRQSILLLCLGLLVAVLLGFSSVRTVTAPVNKLREAALAVTGGALETQVDVGQHDELGELAEAFNTMTRGLREREGLKMTLALSETLALKEVLDKLLESLARAVQYDEASALIKTRDGMDVVVTRGARGRDEAKQIMPSADHVQRAAATQRPALNEGRQMLALPLVQRGLVIGVVCLESQKPYDEPTVRLAFSLAQPAALAVENARLFDEVQRLATLDGLTNVCNRRHFMDLAQLQFETARRFGQPLAAVMLDVDHFKSVNDSHGHHVGDQVLRVLADRCRAELRNIDVLARYGGEEFAILLPGTARHAAAMTIAERIRRNIAGTPVDTDAGPIFVTVSVGVAGMEGGVGGPNELLRRADSALYAAKQGGRNRVVEDGTPELRLA